MSVKIQGDGTGQIHIQIAGDKAEVRRWLAVLGTIMNPDPVTSAPTPDILASESVAFEVELPVRSDDSDCAAGQDGTDQNRRKRGMSPENRAKAAERMREYQRRKREAAEAANRADGGTA
jgi:hypothetical protein